MRVIDPGHAYAVDIYNPDGTPSITFDIDVFVKKIGPNFPGNMGKPLYGTNCQERLRVIIDRVKYLNEQDPCDENEIIISYLRQVLILFEIRAARLKGKKLPFNLVAVENIEPCKTCGHIFDHTHE